MLQIEGKEAEKGMADGVTALSHRELTRLGRPDFKYMVKNVKDLFLPLDLYLVIGCNVTGSTHTYLKRTKDLVNTLKPAAWCTLKWWVLQYMNYMLIKKCKKQTNKKRSKETSITSDTVPEFQCSSKTTRRKKDAGTRRTLHLSLGYGFPISHSAPRG